MRAQALPPISSSWKITPRKPAPTCVASTAGCAATGKSPSGFSHAFRKSQVGELPIPSPAFRAGKSSTTCAARWSSHRSSRSLSLAGFVCRVDPSTGPSPPCCCCSFPPSLNLRLRSARAFIGDQHGQVGEAISGFQRAVLVVLVRLVFLPHETLLAFDAIVRSLVRRFITGERLLEWESAAQDEMQSSARSHVDWYLAATPLVALSLGVLIWLFAAQRWAIFCAAPVLVLWALANPITIWLNRPPRSQRPIDRKDRDFLLAHALRIWRYFREFGVERHNFLIPDNVMEKDCDEAPRVSPTNIGLLLNARQVACELGFLTAPEFVALTGSTLQTIERMEKFRGHLYNWYDTETLAPLDKSPFVSSVDSGNLVASLYTLHAGTRALANKPLLRAGTLLPDCARTFACYGKRSISPTRLHGIKIPGHLSRNCGLDCLARR